MSEPSSPLLHRALFVFYALFVLGSTFSIAIAQAALGMATLLFIVVAVRDRHNPFAGKISLVYEFIGFYLVWLLLASLIGGTPGKSVANCREEWLFAGLLIGVLACQRERWREHLVTVLAVGVGAISLYGFVEYVTGTHWLHFRNGAFVPEPIVRLTGNFAHYLTFANYCATAGLFLFAYAMFPSGLGTRRQYGILLASALAMAATVLTSSRTPIAAVAVGLVFCAFARTGTYRKLAIGLLVVLMAIALLQPGVRDKFGNLIGRDTSTTYEGSRVFIWQRSLDIIVKNPVFGVGPGNFRGEYVSRLRPDIPEERKHAHAHNDFLNVAAVCGIPGMVFFVGLWAVVLRLLGKAAFSPGLQAGERRAAFAALVGSVVFLVTSMTEATFADEEVRQLLMFIWAVGLSVWYTSQPAQATAKVLDTQ